MSLRNVEGRKITNILKVVHFIRDQSHEPREREGGGPTYPQNVRGYCDGDKLEPMSLLVAIWCIEEEPWKRAMIGGLSIFGMWMGRWEGIGRRQVEGVT